MEKLAGECDVSVQSRSGVCSVGNVSVVGAIDGLARSECFSLGGGR